MLNYENNMKTTITILRKETSGPKPRASGSDGPPLYRLTKSGMKAQILGEPGSPLHLRAA